MREPGVAIFEAEVRKESSLDDARDTLLKTVESVAANPPTTEEVERAKTQLVKQLELSLNDSARVGLSLSEWIGMGDWRLLFLYRDRLKKVTVPDVQRVAAAYLKTSNRTVGLFIPTAKPDRSEIPATPDVLAMLKDYKGGEKIAVGEAFDPSPANIDSRTARPDVAGLKLALLPKKTRGGTVTAMLNLRFGDEKSLFNRSAAGDLAGSMLMRGTTKHTRQQLKDEFDRLKARVNVGGSATSATASIETTRENLPAVLKLVAEVLHEPAFPASEFDQLKQEELAGLEQQKSEPQAIAVTAFRRHISPYPKGDVRYVETVEESIADVKGATLDDVKKFYGDFYGASNGEMAVVGDFDAKEIEKLTGDLFGAWKSPQPYKRVPSVYQDVSAVNQSFNTPDKANSLFIAGLPLQIRDDSPDYPALTLGNYILGGGFLNSRLATRIRQKEGLSYGVGSQLNASPLDEYGAFLTFAISAPQNTTKVEAAFKDELARALKEGFTADEIAKAKAGWLQSRQVSRAQDRELAGKLEGYRFLNRTMAFDADFEQKVNALTSDQIVAALRKYLDPNKITIIKAGDFEKKAATAGDNKAGN